MIGSRIAHHGEHVLERQNAGRLSRNASFLCCAIACTLFSSTGFAAACHYI